MPVTTPISDNRCDEDQAAHDSALAVLSRELLRAVSEHPAKQDMLRAVTEALGSAAKIAAVSYCERDETGPLRASFRASSDNATAPAPSEQFARWCDRACRQGAPWFTALPAASGLAVAVPVARRGQLPEGLAIVFESGSSLASASLIAQLSATHVALWHVLADARAAEEESETGAALLELLSRMEQCSRLQDACDLIVGELRVFLGCRQVALGLRARRNGHSRLKSVAPSAGFDKGSELAGAIEDAFDEVILRDSALVCPADQETDRHTNRAHARLCGLAGVASVVSAPLRASDGTSIGAWLFLGDSSLAHDGKRLSLIRAAESRVAACLGLMQRAEPTRLGRLAHGVRDALRGRKGILTWAAAALVATILALPWQHQVSADCLIEPVTRRFVAAPFASTLEKAFVKPGEVVVAGKLLARLDGREVRWKLAGLEADYHQAAKKRDAAMATHDYAKAELARLEMERIEVRQRLLRHRENHLEIKSPIGGVVTSGDLERAEGAPLTLGQTLFEIAPLDRIVVEAAVPEDDFMYVWPGMDVEVGLDAYPGQTWTGTLARVQPRSEIRDDANVFIGEVVLENDGNSLRPGMKGRVKLLGTHRPLAWVLFHKPWETALRWLGW